MEWALMGPTAPDRTGPTFRNQLEERIQRLAQGILIELTDVAGTANAITARVDPGLAAGLKAGMSFLIQTPLANTGAVTLRLYDSTGVTDLTGEIDVVDLTGVALTSGRFQANSFQEVVYSESLSKFIALTDTRTTGRVLDYQAFTSSGTWTKPAGTPANAWVLRRLWGAGGGGGAHATVAGGGGGGAFVQILSRGTDVASSISVTVPAGGAVGSAGGNASFGSDIAYGGGRGGIPGSSTGTGAGGGGGGRLGVGSNGNNGSAISGGDGGQGGQGGGGGGGGGFGSSENYGDGGIGTNDGNDGTTLTGSSLGGFGGDAIDGGGGGGGCAPTSAGTGGDGGDSFRGGGGGGARGFTAHGSGGISLYGGNGGAGGVAGSVRGGGGGGNAAGGRGEVQVWVIS